MYTKDVVEADLVVCNHGVGIERDMWPRTLKQKQNQKNKKQGKSTHKNLFLLGFTLGPKMRHGWAYTTMQSSLWAIQFNSSRQRSPLGHLHESYKLPKCKLKKKKAVNMTFR